MFKTAPDGRMIIKDDSDSDVEPRRKKPNHVPGLSESGKAHSSWNHFIASKHVVKYDSTEIRVN